MTDTTTSGLQPFHVMEILAEAKALEAEGRSIIHLSAGEPGAPPAPEVRAAVRAVLDQPQRYTPAKGISPLRLALSVHYQRQHGVAVDPERIVVTTGSSAGFLLAFLAAIPAGGRIAVTRPGYPAYLNTIYGMGFSPVEIPVFAENGWKLTAEALRAAHEATPFDGLLLASPANPTGAALDRAELDGLADVAVEIGIELISDEIYHGLDYRASSPSALEHTNDAVVINSFSKYHCMTGWRVGWMVLPERLVRKTEMLQQNLFISAPTLSQIAAVAALGATDYAEAQKLAYRRNRDVLAAGLTALGIDGAPGDGAFYHYAEISRFSNDSMVFARALLRQAGVAAAPGVDFDRIEGHRYMRFCYAGTPGEIDEALERIGRFVAG
ncbi:MAG: aminotransferase class I/II-fold pyridoxal phosphate-dependent enzyme [Alphaproteobacteria bacterium]|nr:aminotransferase class I/II-fold pyridoxal phosphate-dependent enzyme [Alphaproteobacteria bacterium]